MYGDENRLDRMEALRRYTVGSAWFSGEEASKGAIVPGQLADLAVLSDDYFAVPELEIKQIESVLTVLGGKIVYAAGDFSQFSPPSLPVLPTWAPVAHYGGYQSTLPVAARAHVHVEGLTCAHGKPRPARSGSGRLGLPSAALGLWGSGCSCWAF
jgi:hypothetical protein